MSSTLQNEYQQLAADYDRRYSVYNRKTDAQTLGALGKLNKESILDLACGTGNLLNHIHQSYPNTLLYGTDISSAMLKVAADKLDKSIQLEQSNAHKLRYPDQSFDIVVSNSAFHFFPDQSAVLNEIQRILKPNGRFVLTDWCRNYAFIKFYDFYLNRIKFAYSHSHTSESIQTLLRQHGFAINFLDKYRIGYTWGLMTLESRKL